MDHKISNSVWSIGIMNWLSCFLIAARVIFPLFIGSRARNALQRNKAKLETNSFYWLTIYNTHPSKACQTRISYPISLKINLFAYTWNIVDITYKTCTIVTLWQRVKFTDLTSQQTGSIVWCSRATTQQKYPPDPGPLHVN